MELTLPQVPQEVHLHRPLRPAKARLREAGFSHKVTSKSHLVNESRNIKLSCSFEGFYHVFELLLLAG